MKTTNKKKNRRAAMLEGFRAKNAPVRLCPNCGEVLAPKRGHFFPPCLNEPGFFTCNKQEPNKKNE